MFSLYQLCAARLSMEIYKQITSSSVMPDVKIENCCRGVITGMSHANIITQYSLYFDHLHCFKSVNKIYHDNEYHMYIKLMRHNKNNVTNIFKYIVDNSLVTQRSIRECINVENIAMLDYMLTKDFVYLTCHLIRTLVYEKKYIALKCILNHTPEITMSRYRRDDVIPIICIQTSTLEIMKLLVENGFNFQSITLNDMIDFKRVDMLEYAIKSNMGLGYDLNLALHSMIVSCFDLQLLMNFKSIIAENVNIMVQILSWHVSFDRILLIYKMNIINDEIMNATFETTALNNIYDTYEKFIAFGYTPDDWLIRLKIINNDYHFIYTIVCNGYRFGHVHLNNIINVHTVRNDIVYLILKNLHVNLCNVNTLELITNDFFHNYFVFKHLLKLGMPLTYECIEYIVVHGMINYVRLCLKYTSEAQTSFMLSVADREKKYTIIAYIIFKNWMRMRV